MKDYVCGIDIGTSMLKVTLVAGDGSRLGPFKREIETVYPQPSYAEQDSTQWFELLKSALDEAFGTGAVDKHRIRAIMPDAATHTVVLLDKHFQPVRRAIMWNDQRSAALADACEISQEIFERTNHMPGAMWSLFQNLWVKTYEPEVWDRVCYMLFPKDYIRYQLTGVYCTDHIDAQGSQLYDVHLKKWSEPLCALLGFPIDKLPPLRHASDVVGGVTSKAARELGLLEGTPVLAGTTDTALEMIAAGAIRKGQGTIKLATSGRICVITDKAYPHKQLVNYSHVADSLYYPGTGTRSCTASLRWFKDHFAQQESSQAAGKNVYALLDEKAAKVPPGCEGLIFHPYLLGEFSPYSNQNLRASFIGASMNHTKAHFIRSVMEGAAYSLRDGMQLMHSLGIKSDAEHLLLIGGGAQSGLWGQIIADMFNTRMAVPEVSDSSFGGAMLAGTVCGMFTNLEEAVKICCKIARVIEPLPSNVEVYNKLFHVYTETVKALMPVYEELVQALRIS